LRFTFFVEFDVLTAAAALVCFFTVGSLSGTGAPSRRFTT
jgi:hypothetical protein